MLDIAKTRDIYTNLTSPTNHPLDFAKAALMLCRRWGDLCGACTTTAIEQMFDKLGPDGCCLFYTMPA